MRITLRFIVEDVDRHGNVRVYFRRHGRKTRLRHPVGSPGFLAEYEALLAAGPAADPAPQIARPEAGTWGWLCTRYLASPAARALDPATLRTRALILRSMLAERVNPDKPAPLYAEFPLSRMTTKALRVLRDRKAGPAAGNNRVRAIRAVYKWAMAEEIVTVNPARDLVRNALPGTGWHTWTDDEIARFEARHPIGTRARLALALLMYTGVRRSDVVRLGRQHERGGDLVFRPWKGRQRANAALVSIPILPELAGVIAQSPTGDLTYLVTGFGRPFAVAGFGNWFRERCDEAGLPQCSAHGLRKAGAARAAENGATVHQLMAVFGWLTFAEAERYTRAADRRRMARSGTPLLAVGQSAPQTPANERNT